MAPPEEILDRLVRTQLRNEPGFSGYVGKLTIERVESPIVPVVFVPNSGDDE